MKIHVYVVAYNEEVLMPYLLRHYAAFASRIVVYDNLSTDRTPEIVRAHPMAELRTFDSGEKIDNDKHSWIKSNAWKEDRSADWIICVDADEFVYHEDVVGYLEGCQSRGVSLIRTIGFDMVSDSPPSCDGQIWQEITRGYGPMLAYCKPVVFDPSKIEEINFCVGAHSCEPVGDVVRLDPSELALLHYHQLGIEWVVARTAKKKQRMFSDAEERGWAYYWESEEDLAQRWMDFNRDAWWII